MISTQEKSVQPQQLSREEKLKVVNSVLKKFAPGTVVEPYSSGWLVKWTSNGKQVTRRWQTMGGGSMYPAWHRKWGHGGTSCAALCQLMRWLQDRPVLPLSTWKYWTGETVKLGDPSIVEMLRNAGYPEQVNCVKCGCTIERELDWWTLGKTSGPGHLGKCGGDK